MLLQRKVVAVHAGALREAYSSVDSKYTAEMRTSHNDTGQFFLETYLPEDVLPVLLRALDTYFYCLNVGKGRQ